MSYNKYKDVYEISNNGYSFYQRGEDIISSMYSMDTGLTINIFKGGAASGSGNSSGSKGLQISEYMYSMAGAYGEAASKRGIYTQTNGNRGNFNDRPYKRLSQNAKAKYDFTRNLKYLKKAGTLLS